MAERERDSGQDGEAQVLAQHPQAVAQVLQQGLHGDPFGVSEANDTPFRPRASAFQGVDGELGLVQLEASAPMTVRVNSP